MLTLRLIPRSIVHQFNKSTPQQLQVTSVKLLSSHDSPSSSSSDSSDSDSDKEDKKIKKHQEKVLNKKKDETLNLSNTKERLDAILQKITEAAQKSKDNTDIDNVQDSSNKLDIAIKPKKDRFIELNKEKPKKEIPFEQQLVQAAKDVANSIKGDSKKTELDLLSKVLNLEKPSSDEKTPVSKEIPETMNLSNLLSNMKVESTSVPSDTLNQKRIQMANKFKKRFQEPSIGGALLHKKSLKAPRSHKIPEAELRVPHECFGIFKDIVKVQMSPQLSTWKAMEEREMRLATLSTPQNAFQELIQWTDQGKLWKFPINNEQGMEEEAKVHFSEHVFMEQHLKDWCPRRGPIRHFMELVCTGLSKNPYMTVEEKVGHISWYRDYFEDKKDLLNELNLLENKPSDMLKDRNHIEA